MNPVSSTDEKFIKRLTEIIDENLSNEDFGAAQLATELGVSRVTLYRKVKSLIKKSISEYIRETRLMRAYDLLKKNCGTVAEISYQVGFRNPPYFNKCFHDFYGITPGDVLKGIEPVSGIEQNETKTKKPGFTFSYLHFITLTVIVVAAGLLIYFKHFEIPVNEEDKFIILVIPPFNDENPESGNDKAKLIRLELHNRLNISQLKVKDQSITDDSTFLKIGHQKLIDLLKVDYVLRCDRSLTDEGARYFFRLLNKDGSIIWREDFFENEKSANEFAANIADFIIRELDIELNPEERNQIKKLPSENVFALKMYEDGMKLLDLSNTNLEDMYRAINSFETAIRHDSTFADAYAHLCMVYSFLLPEAEQDIPKAKQYILKALQYENKYRWYYNLLAGCFEAEGNEKAADSCRKIGNQFARKDKYFYGAKAHENHVNGKHYESIRYSLIFSKMNEDTGEPSANHGLVANWQNYALMGFPEVAKKYLIMMMEHWGTDSTNTSTYWNWLKLTYFFSRDYQNAHKYAIKLYRNDSTNTKRLDDLIGYEMLLGNIEKSYYYVELIDSIRKARNIIINPGHGNLSYAFACVEAGKKEKAMFIINSVIEKCKNEIEQNKPFAKTFKSHMHLAALYAYLDEKEKSLEFLTLVKDSKANVGYHRLLLDLPVFERISKEDREIRNVINDLKKQYNKEHNKIKKLLREEGLLES